MTENNEQEQEQEKEEPKKNQKEELMEAKIKAYNSVAKYLELLYWLCIISVVISVITIFSMYA